MSKYLDSNGLLYFYNRLKNIFATQANLTDTNTNVTALQNQVDSLVAEGGEPNVIESVQVNGSALPVSSKTVNVPVPTNNNQLTNGAGYQTAQQVQATITGYGYATTTQLNNGLAGKQNTLTFDTVPTQGSSNPVTSGGIYSAFATAISGAYKYKGSVATQEDLPSSGNTVGDVWNVQADGMNYAWNGTSWDSLGSDFTIEAMSNSDIDNIMAS
jgi:hypothetical protein